VNSRERPKFPVVTAILAAAHAPSRDRAFARLLAAGCDEVQVVEVPEALAYALTEAENTPLELRDGAPKDPLTVVVVGGAWPASRPFLTAAANAEAVTVVMLSPDDLSQDAVPLSTNTLEALSAGARAVLSTEIPTQSLATALAAVQSGLIVIEPAAGPSHTHKANSHATTGQRSHNRRSLTSREREILALVAGGTSNKGIARALSVSANTVKFHLAAVFDKLNAATRAEAVAEAIRRGELSL